MFTIMSHVLRGLTSSTIKNICIYLNFWRAEVWLTKYSEILDAIRKLLSLNLRHHVCGYLILESKICPSMA